MHASTSSEGQPAYRSAISPSRHHYTASTLSLRIAVDWDSAGSRGGAKAVRRYSASSCTSGVHRGDPLLPSDSSWFAHDSPERLPRIAVTSDEAGEIPFDDSSASFGGLLDELESLACTARLLPIPDPPSTSLSVLFEAVDLTMSSSLSMPDTNSPETSPDAYTEAEDDFYAHTIIIEDSGYLSELSSPALSEPSFDFDDLERTPRGPRPRAPSPLTPITPDFAFSPTLPRFYSPYQDPMASSPIISTPLEFSSTLSSSLEIKPLPQDPTPHILRRQPSKPRFLQTMLGRRRAPDLSIHVPDSSDHAMGRASLGGPRTASFLNLKNAKRGLRRQKSEGLFLTRKAASVDDLELESFFNF